MNETKSTNKVSFINLLYNYGNAIFIIINGLILMPIYLRHFSIATYGSYLSSGNIISILGLLDGGMSFVLTQKLSSAFYRKDLKEFSNTLGSSFFLSFTILLIFVLTGFALVFFIPDLVKAELDQSKNIQIAFILSAISAGFGIIFHNLSSIFQALLQVKKSGNANIVSIIFGVITTLFSLYLGIGVISIPLGLLVKNTIGNLVLIYHLYFLLIKEKIPKIKLKYQPTLYLVKSIIPMFFGGISKSLITNSQLLIITNFISPTASAIYFITGRIYLVCESFIAPIGSSIFGSISKIFTEQNIENTRKSVLTIFSIFNTFSILIISISFILNESFITLFLGNEKYGGLTLSILLAINVFLSSRFSFLSTILYSLGVFGKTVLFDTLGGIIRVIIILLTIGKIGYISIPIAELFTSLILLGYYINKLVINKLELLKSNSTKFIISGWRNFILLVLLIIIWKFVFHRSNNWSSFIFEAISFFIISFFISILLNNDLKQFIINIKSNLKSQIIKNV